MITCVKNLIVCADDYAQNAAISEGILNALTAKRINAVSCLTNMTDWFEAGQVLHATKTSASIGLHLNFTQGQPLSTAWKNKYGIKFKSLIAVISSNYLKYIDRACIEAECLAQLNRFRLVMKRNPDFIDGHQHVHQLPMIRQVLLSIYAKEQLTGWMRVSDYSRVFNKNLVNPLKMLMIAQLGGFALRRLVTQMHIPTHTSFSGIYRFEHAAQYAQLFKKFLSGSEPNGLIMCHPGLLSEDQSDPIRVSRSYELDYFMSDDYLADLEAYGFKLF